MLFDLQSGRRKRVVQVVYSLLAASFLIGFVIFGIGTNGIGSISDLFGGGSGGSTSSGYDTQISQAQSALKKNPKNEQALANLATYEFLKGKTGVSQSSPTAAPQVSSDAQDAFGAAADAWTRYLNVVKKPDPALASEMAQAYAILNDANGAARAQRIFAEAQPSTNTLGTLAAYLYFAGNFAAGDAATKKAVAKATTKSQATQTKSGLAQVKKRAQKFAQQQKAAQKAQGGGKSGSELQNPFGGLGGSATP